MTVFVDTSVWFAAVFAKDTHHASARRILSDEPSLTTTDHIIVETWLLLKNRFNQIAAEAEMIRVAFSEQRFSLVDRTSFVVMERLAITRAASFDDDFVIYRYGPRRDRAFEVLR